jgi:hypothetical protein
MFPDVVEIKAGQVSNTKAALRDVCDRASPTYLLRALRGCNAWEFLRIG